MNSATSIDRSARAAERTTPANAEKNPADDSFRPWHFFVVASLLAATVAVVLVRQRAPEHLLLLSVIVAVAGLSAAALYGTLAPLVRKGSDHEPARLSDRSRAALEREKMLVLRSIKELEFDRAMGKMSAGDFDEMAGRLRARALALMKQIDANAPGYRATIENELAERLQAGSVAPQTCRCGTTNDADAAFCKRCGNRLQAEPGTRPT